MQDSNGGMSCALGSWALAAGGGALLTVLLLAIGGWGVIGAIFFGGLIFMVLGILFNYLFCRSLPPIGSVEIGQPTGLRAVPPDGHGADTPKSPASAPASGAAAASDGSSVKPSKALAGEDELSARKGTWSYGGEGASQSDATPEAVAEASDEGGQRPAALEAPRDGAADDLKKIKGIGPKLETLCNSLGFYHFDQIANWTASEVAWVDDNLEGFRGRVTRDDWVEQARLLATGEDTEFSKKVDKGGVY